MASLESMDEVGIGKKLNVKIPHITDLTYPLDNQHKKRSKWGENIPQDISNALENKLEIKIIQYSLELSSHNKDRQLKGAQGIRKLLSAEKIPPISECIKIGIIPVCLSILNKKGKYDLKYEAAWILTNISAGTAEQTKKVVEMGAIDPLFKSMQSDNVNLVTQSCWVLTNCMGDNIETRDELFKKGIVPLLADTTRAFRSERNLLKIVSWCFSTAFHGKRTPAFNENIVAAIPALGSLAKKKDTETIEEILNNTCLSSVCAFWALSSVVFIAEEDSEEDSILLGNIFEILEEREILPRFIENIGSDNLDFVYPCLRAVGNIVSGPDEHTEKIVNLGVLSPLCKALQHEKTNIVKESAWILSNISAGTLKHINAVVNSGAVPLLLNVIYNNEFRAKKEAIWAIANITNGGNENHIINLYRCGAIKCLCYSLSVPDWNTILVVFEALENMLKTAKNISTSYIDRFRSQFEEHGGFDKVFDLQHHENDSVHQKAFSFIQQFYYEGVEQTDSEVLKS